MLQPQQAAPGLLSGLALFAADTVIACSVSILLQKDICQTQWQHERQKSISSR